MKDAIIMGNLFDFAAEKHILCIPINTTLDSKKRLVMGAGLARQAVDRFPDLPAKFGEQVFRGNIFPTYVNGIYRLKGLPSKRDWKEASKWEYLYECIEHLLEMHEKRPDLIYIVPLLGAGLGELNREEVREYLEGVALSIPTIKVIVSQGA